MYDARHYPDRYDLYRPTLVASATGEVTREAPETPTLANARCRFVDDRGRLFQRSEGIAVDHDARLRLPAGADLRPKAVGDAPDTLVLTQLGGEAAARTFLVVAVVRHANATWTAYLKEAT
jgi:hypothetical protein